MERNVGGMDRTARVVLGILFVLVSIVTVAFGASLGEGTQLVVAAFTLLLAAILLVTAGAKSCPINSAVGRNTYRRESRL